MPLAPGGTRCACACTCAWTCACDTCALCLPGVVATTIIRTSTAATIPLRVPYRGVGETRRVPAHVRHGKLDDLVVTRVRVRARVRVTVRVGVRVRVRARIRARVMARARGVG